MGDRLIGDEVSKLTKLKYIMYRHRLMSFMNSAETKGPEKITSEAS
jgi:hypothetical protein